MRKNMEKITPICSSSMEKIILWLFKEKFHVKLFSFLHSTQMEWDCFHDGKDLLLLFASATKHLIIKAPETK